MKREQVVISAHDEIRRAARRQLQELVVFRIAAGPDLLLRLDQPGVSEQASEETRSLLLAHIALELLAAKYIV